MRFVSDYVGDNESAIILLRADYPTKHTRMLAHVGFFFGNAVCAVEYPRYNAWLHTSDRSRCTVDHLDPKQRLWHV